MLKPCRMRLIYQADKKYDYLGTMIFWQHFQPNFEAQNDPLLDQEKLTTRSIELEEERLNKGSFLFRLTRTIWIDMIQY
jgi:hypothetical protein